MKYNIKTIDTFGQSLKSIVLKNRNLTEEDVYKLFNLDLGKVAESPFQIFGMDNGIKLFMQEFDKQSNIGIICDPDVDGFCSTATIYLFLKKANYPMNRVRVFFHEGKMHSLKDEKLFKEIKKSNVELLITPDCCTNDEREIKMLLDMGKKVLTIDHHIKSEDNKLQNVYKNQNGELIYALVNNQLGEHCKDFCGG